MVENTNLKQATLQLKPRGALYEGITSRQNLKVAFYQVKKNKGSYGIDRVSIKQYERNLERNIAETSRLLKQGRYKPLPVKRVWILKPDGRKRPLGIPAVRDRIVQQSLLMAIQPLFEPTFSDVSYGFRPNKSAIEAVNKVQEYLDKGHQKIFEADIEDFFSNVNHNRLVARLRERIDSKETIKLIRKFLNSGVMEEGNFKKQISGTPQGGVISPLFANVYLNDFDHKIEKAGLRMVRYADDFVILCKTDNQAVYALRLARDILQSIGLKLKPEKTGIVSYFQGFEFLGYRFQQYYGNYKWPRDKAVKAFKDKIRHLTRRQQPKNIKMLIPSVNYVVRGWGNYFKHGNVKTRFDQLDSWLRMRLRSFIGKRKWPSGLNWKYPNDHFKDLGLVCLSDLLSSPNCGQLYRRAVCGKSARTVREKQDLLSC